MRTTIFTWKGTAKEWREIQKMKKEMADKRRLEKMGQWIKGK